MHPTDENITTAAATASGDASRQVPDKHVPGADRGFGSSAMTQARKGEAPRDATHRSTIYDADARTIPASTARFAGRRVLVADDNPVNLQIARSMLEQFGCAVALANNGREAVDMHRISAYELILMDCQMPELDGYQATSCIRALDGGASRTPVIALTASSAREEQGKCTAAGMNGFISKPIRAPGLQALLEQWLHVDIASMQGSSAACVDELEAVQQMFGRDFSDLAAMYQSDSPPRIALLHEAQAAGDSAGVAKIAHALGGSSASIGAMTLCALCRDLELQARHESLENFAKQMAAIETEYRRVSGRLRSMAASDN